MTKRTIIVKLKFAKDADVKTFFDTLEEGLAIVERFAPELRGEAPIEYSWYEIAPGYGTPVTGDPPRPVEFSDWVWG